MADSDVLKRLDAYGDRIRGITHFAVNVHPLADECDVLARLKLVPEDFQ